MHWARSRATLPTAASPGQRAAPIEELTRAGWETPYSSRVDSLTNYTHSEADGDDLVVRPACRKRAGSGRHRAGGRQVDRVVRDRACRPPGVPRRPGRRIGHHFRFAVLENSDPAVIEITDYLRATLDKARTDHPQIRYYLTGDVVMNRAFADTTQEDLRTLAPIVFPIIAVVAAALLRSVWGTVASLVVLVFILNSTVGFAGWIGTVFGPANSGSADNRHDGRHSALDPYRCQRARGHASRSRPGSRDRRVVAGQYAAGVSHLANHRDRVPEPELFGFAAVPPARQSGCIRCVVRFRLFHGPAAGAIVRFTGCRKIRIWHRNTCCSTSCRFPLAAISTIGSTLPSPGRA